MENISLFMIALFGPNIILSQFLSTNKLGQKIQCTSQQCNNRIPKWFDHNNAKNSKVEPRQNPPGKSLKIPQNIISTPVCQALKKHKINSTSLAKTH